MLTRKEMKNQAMYILLSHWKMIIPVIIICIILPTTISQLDNFSWVAYISSLVGGFFAIKVSLMAIRMTEQMTMIDFFKKSNSSEFATWFTTEIVVGLLSFLWFFVPIYGIMKIYSYQMAPYLAVDNPNEDFGKLIKQSAQMMDGHKMEFFVLQISFIWWILGSIISFGLLTMWYVPYQQVTSALFYENLLKNQNA